MSTYCIVLRNGQGHYLQLVARRESNGNTVHTIAAYKTLEEAKDMFKSFYTDMYLGNYQRYIECGLTIINLSPIIVKVSEDSTEMQKYAVDGNAMLLQMGYQRWPVMAVKKDIEALQVLDVAHDVIWRPQPDRREQYAE